MQFLDYSFAQIREISGPRDVTTIHLVTTGRTTILPYSQAPYTLVLDSVKLTTSPLIEAHLKASRSMTVVPYRLLLVYIKPSKGPTVNFN